MKKLFFWLPTLLPLKSFSTTIVIIIYGNTITIGADSKVFLTNTDIKNGKTAHSTGYYNTCKISRVNDVLLTGDGLYADKAISLLGSSISSNYLSNSINSVISSASNKITPSIELERKFNNKIYLLHCVNKQFCEVFICLFENKNPVVYEVSFTCINNPNAPVKIKYGVKKISNSQIITAGEKEDINAMIKTKKAFDKKSIANGIYDLIYLETQKEPLMVGAPINVVEMQNNGSYTWIYNGNCKF